MPAKPVRVFIVPVIRLFEKDLTDTMARAQLTLEVLSVANFHYRVLLIAESRRLGSL
jgi:hypothetical protein